MAIQVKIGSAAAAPEQEAEKKPIQHKSSINIRKTLDGNLVLFSHPEIDIVISPENKKIIAFPKDEMGDHVYSAQSRLFDFLVKKGVTDPSSIQGGSVYSSMEAAFLESDEVDSVQAVVFTVDKFIKEELPYYRRDQEYEEELEKDMLYPDEKDSTELGEVPHQKRKGTIHRWPGSTAAYGMTGMYRA